MTFFLIGFMGSGKTHWGKIWAEEYNLTFIDLDELIEKREGKTIAEIFANDGETFFRQIEAATLRSIDNKKVCIVACGGGTACFLENMQWMNNNGTTIYLSSAPAEIFDRVLPELQKRPLISTMSQTKLLVFIEQKLKERSPYYEAATVTLVTSNLSKNSFGEILAGVQSDS